MRNYDFFNKRRVSTQDMNNMQQWLYDNVRNYLGVHLEKGIIRSFDENILGSSDFDFIKKPQQVAFKDDNYVGTPDEGNYFDLPIETAGTTGMYFVDDDNKLFFIVSDENYKASPTEFENQGNKEIPLTSGNGDYSIWIKYKQLKNSSFNTIDKKGVLHNPQTYEGYELIIKFNDTTAPSSSAVYLGLIRKDTTQPSGQILKFYDDVNNPISTPPMRPRKYSGIKQENVNINVDIYDPPAEYTYNTKNSLKDHINAIGDGSVNPKNPHGVHPDNIQAVDAEKFSEIDTFSNRIGLMRNGIIAHMDQLQRIDWSKRLTEIYNNTPTEWYVRLPSITGTSTGTNFVYNGKIYSYDGGEVENIDPIDNRPKVYFDPAVDSEGWYLIYISKVNDGDEYLTLQKNQENPSYPNTDDTRIHLGFVFWKNSGGTIQLQQNERHSSPSNGDTIFPTPTLGCFNQEKFAEVRSEKFHGISTKNIFPNSGFKYDAPIIDNKINGVLDINNADYSVVTDSIYSFNKALRLYNINSGATAVITLPDHINAEGNIFTFSFKSKQVLPSGGYIKITIGTRSYIIPDRQNTKATTILDWEAGNSSLIIIEFLNTTADTSNYVEFDDIQILKSTHYQPNNILDDITAGEIFYDSNNAPEEKRTEIKNQSLNTSLLNSVVNGTIKNYDDITDFTGNSNISQNPINMEMFFLRGRCVYHSGTDAWTAEWNYDTTKYKILHVNFNLYGDHTSAHSGFREGWVEISGNTIRIRIPRYNYSSVPADRPFIWAIAFVERIN